MAAIKQWIQALVVSCRRSIISRTLTYYLLNFASLFEDPDSDFVNWQTPTFFYHAQVDLLLQLSGQNTVIL